MAAPRVVVDLNVCVSALLGSAACRTVLAAVFDRRVVPVVSPRLLDDLRRVLHRPKFRSCVTTAAIEELLRLLESHALLVTPRQEVQISRDLDDDHLFSVAIFGGATAIISGDLDVLRAPPIGGLTVISPRRFPAWLAKK